MIYTDERDILLALMFVVLVIMAIIFYSQPTQKALRNEAVSMGHARYVVDNKGRVNFEWLATQTAEWEAENELLKHD